MTRPYIVVGVDGSSESRHALLWAVEEARRRRTEVHVVHAWSAIPGLEPNSPVRYDADWDSLRNVEAPRCVEEFVDHTLAGRGSGLEITVEVRGDELARPQSP